MDLNPRLGEQEVRAFYRAQAEAIMRHVKDLETRTRIVEATEAALENTTPWKAGK